MSIDEFVSPLDAANRPEIIPCPKEFDFGVPSDPDWVHRKTTTYVEPMIVRTPIPPASPVVPDPTAITPGLRLIYATSGSQVQDYEFRVRIFFKNMISMMQTQGMDGYFLVLEAQDRLRIAQNNLASANRVYGLIKQRFDVGTASALDTAQHESLVNTVRASIPPLQQALRQNVATLALLIGRVPEAVRVHGGSMSRLRIPPVTPGMPSDLIVQRPDQAPITLTVTPAAPAPSARRRGGRAPRSRSCPRAPA